MSKLKVSKTLYWKTENGEVINLDDLPGNVQQQIEIFDAMREDLTDIKYQEQVYSLALATKKHQIEQIIVGMINAQAQQGAAAQASSQTADMEVSASTEE